MITLINENTKSIHVNKTLDINFVSKNVKIKDSNATIDNDFEISLNSEEENLFFNFNNNQNIRNSFMLSFNYDILVEAKFNSILFAKDDYNYFLTSEDCLFEVDNEGIVIVRLNDKSSSIKLSYYNHHKKQDSFRSLSYQTDATIVTENDYMPEFSIATFDDSSFSISRPIRQGVPIISTVPSFVNNNSTSADISYFNNGKGNYYKTIYFRIICNKVMETLSPNDLSEMKLKIYMPNGLDTVKTAIYNDMYLVSNDTTNNYSIYRSSFNFYIQGNFDGIDYVDGYMYADVHVPLTVQTIMPIEIDFTV
jgi:hypothetical protein